VGATLVYAQPELAAPTAMAQCGRCSECCDCTTGHVCYSCGPDDGIITDYRCYPDASFVIPVSVGITVTLAIIFLIWLAYRYHQARDSNATQQTFESMHHSVSVNAIYFTLTSTIFFVLGFVWHPVWGVDTGCDDCHTMDHAFWALFACMLTCLIIVGLVHRNAKRAQMVKQPQFVAEAGNTAYVPLNHD